MNPRYLYVVLIGLFTSALFGGCSIRPIPFDQPFDEEEASYERPPTHYDDYGGHYRSRYGGPPLDFYYDAWRMSQYYRHAGAPYYAGYASGFGGLPPDRMNIDPNPNDSYRSGESPPQRAQSQHSVQPEKSYRQNSRPAEHRRNNTSFQRRSNRSRHASASRSANAYREKERDERRQFKGRHRQLNRSPTRQEAHEEQRRKVRRRARNDRR